jgi:hypothetical protein
MASPLRVLLRQELGQNEALHQDAWQERTLTVVRNETRQLMRQTPFLPDPVVKGLEPPFVRKTINSPLLTHKIANLLSSIRMLVLFFSGA